VFRPNLPADDWKKAREATPEQIGAFSLGVVLYQMFSGTDETRIDEINNKILFDKECMKNGSFIYNEHSEKCIDQNTELLGKSKRSDIKNFIQKLCEHNSEKRLTNLDEIDQLLVAIADAELVEITCEKCHKKVIKISRDTLDRLRAQKKKRIQCPRSCMDARQKEYEANHPEVQCVKCRKKFRLRKDIIKRLKSEGKPLLCQSCMDARQKEYEANHPEIQCVKCRKKFRMRKDIVDRLRSQRKGPVCKDCMNKRRRKPPVRNTDAGGGLLSNIRKLFK